MLRSSEMRSASVVLAAGKLKHRRKGDLYPAGRRLKALRGCSSLMM